MRKRFYDSEILAIIEKSESLSAWGIICLHIFNRVCQQMHSYIIDLILFLRFY